MSPDPNSSATQADIVYKARGVKAQEDSSVSQHWDFGGTGVNTLINFGTGKGPCLVVTGMNRHTRVNVYFRISVALFQERASIWTMGYEC